MTLHEFKEKIFGYGNVQADWEEDEVGTLSAVQAEGEYILSEMLTDGEITRKESLEMMSKLMNDYGVDYPFNPFALN